MNTSKRPSNSKTYFLRNFQFLNLNYNMVWVLMFFIPFLGPEKKDTPKSNSSNHSDSNMELACPITDVHFGNDGPYCVDNEVAITLSFSADNGNPPYTITLNDGSGNFTYTSNSRTAPFTTFLAGNAPRTYTLVEIRDSDGCSVNPNETTTVTFVDKPIANPVSGPNTVAVGDNITLMANPSGSAGPYEAWLWQIVSGDTFISFASTTVQNPTITGIAAGTAEVRYRFAYDDGNPVHDCVAEWSDPFTITVTGGCPTITGELSHATGSICESETLNLNFNNFTGGMPPYTVTLSDGVQTYNFAGINNGDSREVTPSPITTTTYTITSITDADGCSGTPGNSVEVIVFNRPIAGGLFDEFLFVGNDATVTAAPSAGSGTYVNYTWTETSGSSAVNFTDNGDGTLTIVGVATGTAAFSYTVEDDNGCISGTSSFNVTVSACPSMITVLQPDPLWICPGEPANLTIGITDGVPPYLVTLSDGTNTIDYNNITDGNQLTLPNEVPNTVKNYTVSKIVDANGCVTNSPGNSVEVTFFENPIANAITGPTIVETGNSITLTANPSGGSGNYVLFNWSETTGNNTITINDNGDGTATINGIAAGTASITYSVEDNHGCQSTTSTPFNLTVIDCPALTSSLTPTTLNVCPDSSAVVTVNITNGLPPYTVTLSDGTTTTPFNGINSGDQLTLAGEVAGTSRTYSISEIIDANGCRSSTSGGSSQVNFVERPQANPITGLTEVAVGNSITLMANPTGGSGTFPTITWNVNSGTTHTTVVGNGMTATVTGISPGFTDIYYTVTDDNGCLSARSQIFTVTIVNGCSEINTIVSAEETICEGVEVFVDLSFSGGTPPYSINIDDATTILSFTNLPSDTTLNLGARAVNTTVQYTFRDILDSNGCPDNQSYVQLVTTKPKPIGDPITGPSTVRVGDSIQIAANPILFSELFSYNWSIFEGAGFINQIGNDSIITIVGVAPGVASISYTVTDINSCLSLFSEEFLITVIDCPEIIGTISNSGPVCAGTSVDIDVNITGGTGPYTVLINDGQQDTTINTATTSLQITSLVDSTTTFSLVSIQDNSGCPPDNQNATTQVIVSPLLSIEFNTTDASCGLDNGHVKANISGGTPPYVVQWSNNEIGDSISNITADTYFITVADFTSCQRVDSVVVNDTEKVTINCSVTNNVTTEGGSDGIVNIAVNGGLPPLTINWMGISSGQQAGVIGDNEITNLMAGNYTFLVRDGNDCVDSCRVVVEGPNCNFTLTAFASPPSCAEVSDGIIQLDAPAAALPVTYFWTNETNSGTNTGFVMRDLIPGNYNITLTDNNGCSDSTSALVADVPNIRNNLNATICQGETFEVGNSSYSNTGTFFDTLVAANGCDSIVELVLQVNSTPTIAATDTTTYNLCSDNSTVDISVVVQNGFEVDWYDASEGGNVIGSNQNPYAAPNPGLYFAEARDPSNGCVSDNRVQLEVSALIPPVLSIANNSLSCSEDRLTYEYTVISDLDITFFEVGMNTEATQIDANTLRLFNIPIGEESEVSIASDSGCFSDLNISSPDCNCTTEEVPAPTSDGDQVTCERAAILPLTVTVADSFFVDWYDQPFGGMLLATESNSFTPTTAGTYFAEARNKNTNCPSGSRTPVTLTISPSPNFQLDERSCSQDFQSYRINFSTNASTVTPSVGDLQDLGNGNYLISNIPISDEVDLSLGDDVNNCGRSETITPPACVCAESITGELTEQICSGNTFDFNGQSLTTTGIYRDTLIGGAVNGCDSMVILNLTVVETISNIVDETFCPGEGFEYCGETLTAAGNYQCVFTSVRGCDSIVNLVLTEKSSVDSLSISINQSLVITDFENATNINLFEGLENDNAPNDPSIEVLHQPQAGSIVSSRNGLISYQPQQPLSATRDSLSYLICNQSCSVGCDTVSVAIQFRNDCVKEAQANIPNVFTPNGDGVNDLFDPLADFVETCIQDPSQPAMRILNRWGDIVFSKDIYEPWDGKSMEDQVVPQGTYYYIITFKLDKKQMIRGPINVIGPKN